MLTRRDLIKLGLVGTGYIMLPYDQPFAPMPSSFADDGFRSPPTTPWLDPLPLPAPPVDVDQFSDTPLEFARYINENTLFFDISAERRIVRFHSQLEPTPIWGYRDLSLAAAAPSVLGPTFKLRFGAGLDLFGNPTIAGRTIVRHRNNLPADHRGFGVTRTTVHLHGAHLPARSDGFPDNLEHPPAPFPARVVNEIGQHFDHAYPLLDTGFEDDFEAGVPHVDCGETPTTLWYHDHLLDFTAPNAYRGLAGFFLVFDNVEPNAEKTALDIDDETREPEPGLRYLQLPSGNFDIPLVIQDKSFARDGTLIYSSFDHDGFLGDKICVNGAIQPYLRVQRRKYRFRFLNGSNARIYQLFLADGTGVKYPMDMIATEGGLLAAPIRNISNFTIAMAERFEVVIDFTNYPDGTELFIENRMRQDEGRRGDGTMSRGPQILKFCVDGEPVEDPSRVPDVLRPFTAVTEEEKATAVRRYFRFDRSHGAWTINGELAGHLERVVARPKVNRGEIWRLENNSGGWWHPIHIHSEYFRVLKRNGRTPPLHERDGMAKKDTILLRDNETVDVYLKFRDHRGPFVFHCHNMEHEDMQMMARFDVVEP